MNPVTIRSSPHYSLFSGFAELNVAGGKRVVSRSIVEIWKQLTVDVADGNELMLAYFEDDGRSLKQAIWSSSAYLSWIYFCGLASEIALDELNRIAQTQGDIDQIRENLQRLRPASERRLLGRERLEKGRSK